MNGTVAWDLTSSWDATVCIEVNPCQLYETCPVVEDPLREISA